MTSPVRIGVFTKMLVGLVPLLISVGLLFGLSVAASERAVSGTKAVESEFSERSASDEVLAQAAYDLAVVERQLETASPSEAAELEGDVEASGAKLDALVERLLAEDRNGRRSIEVDLGARVKETYQRYRRVREDVRRTAGSRRAGITDREEGRLRQGALPLRDALTRFSDAHFREAQAILADARMSESLYQRSLIAVLLCTALSLLAVGAITRRLVVRLREKTRFAMRVATGDLAARVQPHGHDELATLGRSLNAMVEQLDDASRHRREVEEAERAYHTAHDALAEALQVSETEGEAHDVLKRHIERSVPDSGVVVLNRNNSQNRLKATTPLATDSVVAKALETAEPRSCLAVRLARTHSSSESEASLLECGICGKTPELTTCVPLLVSGEVIGSVLVKHPENLDRSAQRTVQDAVGQAAPTLANLRNLALAEARAATDVLTGLPNRRSMEDALKRMLAQADRVKSPLAAIMLDLDHFKSINDDHGHDQGDAVLAGVGDVLASTIRGGDFAARNGGEEFVVLLPATGPEGAAVVAEGIRSAISARAFPGIRRAVTASLGVAIYPDDASDSDMLLRLADRALYDAKSAGRNRVEGISAKLAVAGGQATDSPFEVLTPPVDSSRPAGAASEIAARA